MHPTTEETTHNRLHGLDTLRSIAIILVLMYHYKVFVSQENTFGFITQVGWTGVDLFFVLSGYLIGNQIFSALAKGQLFSLKLFYARRALRTLPNYYLVLSLYLLFPVELSGTETPPLWKFLTFTQNFGLHPGETFTHSWSLCIEEQFYFLLPIIALFISSTKKSLALGWLMVLGIMIFCIALRGYNWYSHGQAEITAKDYWQHIYYSSFTRFDELLPGIAIAMFKNFHSHAFNNLIKRGNLLLCAGLTSTAVTLYLLATFFYIDNYGFSFQIASIGFTLLACSFSILVLAALSPHSLLYKIHIPGAAQLALWSYAIYLIHRPIFTVLTKLLNEHTINVKSFFGVSIILAISILGGWLLYTLVETPIMNIRKKIFPSNFSFENKKLFNSLNAKKI